jgi:hypothetical protein
VSAVVLDVGVVSLTGVDVSLGRSVRQARRDGHLLLAHAGTLQFEAVGAVDDAVNDRISDRQIAEHFGLPLFPTG